MPVGPEPLATMMQISDDVVGQTLVTTPAMSLTEDELVATRAALHAEICRVRQILAGTETGVSAHLVQVYRKVIVWLERLQPSRLEHGWHRACLTTAEQALSRPQSGPAASTAPLPASVPHQRTPARVPDQHSLTAEVGRLRSALRYIYWTYCRQHTDQGAHVAWHALTVELPALIEDVLPGIARRAQACRTTAPAAHKG